jgi:Response regulator containing CheY-like receiver domain and AraC-type DNA-binding domain
MYSLLIVDDEPLTREFFKSGLSSVNPDWRAEGEAKDGMEAVNFLKAQDVDLVITDIKMPEMSGLELCEKIRAVKPEQEIIVLSGYDEFTYAQQAMRYQVHGYLLKPIKMQMLKNMLDEVSEKLEKRRNQETVITAMQHLSADYQSHIRRNYLRAIIQDQQTEIKALHPILYKLKIDLMQAQGIILVLRLDTESILMRKLPPEDLLLYKYVLFETATGIVKAGDAGYAVLDTDENTVVFLTGDSAEALFRQCADVFSRAAEYLFKQAGLTVTGFIGDAGSEILEMRASYQNAVKLYNLWACRENGRLYSYPDADSELFGALKNADAACTAVLAALIDGDEASFKMAVSRYAALNTNVGALSVMKYALLLLQYTKKYRPDFSGERYLSCLKKLAADLVPEHFRAARTEKNKKAEETDIGGFYADFLQFAWNGQENKPDKTSPHDLVKDAKAYIYQHFSEPITLLQIADVLCVSPNYLSRIFHESVGESYIKFITKIRMEYAAKLLKADSADYIFKIAEKTGYYNLKHFNFVFKEYYGMTPTEYQKSAV